MYVDNESPGACMLSEVVALLLLIVGVISWIRCNNSWNGKHFLFYGKEKWQKGNKYRQRGRGIPVEVTMRQEEPIEREIEKEKERDLQKGKECRGKK